MERANAIAARANRPSLGEAAPGRQSGYTELLQQALQATAGRVADEVPPHRLSDFAAALEAAAMGDPEMMQFAISLRAFDDRIAMNMANITQIDRASRENSHRQQVLTKVREALEEQSTDDDRADIYAREVVIEGMSIAEYLRAEGVDLNLIDASVPEGTPIEAGDPSLVGGSGARIIVSADTLDLRMEDLRSEATEISRSRDLVMMQIQNDVSKRKQLIQLQSNLFKSMAETTLSVIRNMQ